MFDDGPDDARFPCPVAVLDHQGIQAILRVHRLLHMPVGRQLAHAADAPVHGGPLTHQPVEVHRLVRTVKAADADMDHADRYQVSVVRWQRHYAAPEGQCSGVERAGRDKTGHCQSSLLSRSESCGDISPDPRVTRRVGTCTVSGVPPGSRMRCTRISAARVPMAGGSCAITLMPGSRSSPSGTSSKPTGPPCRAAPTAPSPIPAAM